MAEGSPPTRESVEHILDPASDLTVTLLRGKATRGAGVGQCPSLPSSRQFRARPPLRQPLRRPFRPPPPPPSRSAAAHAAARVRGVRARRRLSPSTNTRPRRGPQHRASPTPPKPDRAEPRARRGPPHPPKPHPKKASPDNRPPASPPGGRPALLVGDESVGRPPLAPRQPAEARPDEVHHRGRRVLRRRMLVLARSPFVRTDVGPLGE